MILTCYALGASFQFREMLQDAPVLLRHWWNQLTLRRTAAVLFHGRMGVLVIIYVLSPLDIIPEAIFGIIGCDAYLWGLTQFVFI